MTFVTDARRPVPPSLTSPRAPSAVYDALTSSFGMSASSIVRPYVRSAKPTSPATQRAIELSRSFRLRDDANDLAGARGDAAVADVQRTVGPDGDAARLHQCRGDHRLRAVCIQSNQAAVHTRTQRRN